jgi:tripartite-type tricarboxylate transporter receptor subunit TctC
MNEISVQVKRRCLLALAALAALAAAIPAWSQTGDSGMTRLVIPFAAGGGTDVVARLVADGLRDSLKETVLIENKAGGGGIVGAASVARAKPDGRTLLFTPQSPITIAQFLDPKPTYDAEKAFVPIAILAKTPLVLLVNSDLPVNNLFEFVAYSKANPDKLNYGVPSPEFGYTTELLARGAGIRMTGVPYRGSGQAMTDLMAGHIQVLLSSAGPAKAQLSSGKARPIAIVGPDRLADFPGVPSTAEAGLNNLKVFGWFGMFAPSGTPEPVLAKLKQAALDLAQDPAYKVKLNGAGYEPLAIVRPQLDQVLDEHRQAWRSVALQTK